MVSIVVSLAVAILPRMLLALPTAVIANYTWGKYQAITPPDDRVGAMTTLETSTVSYYWTDTKRYSKIDLYGVVMGAGEEVEIDLDEQLAHDSELYVCWLVRKTRATVESTIGQDVTLLKVKDTDRSCIYCGHATEYIVRCTRVYWTSSGTLAKDYEIRLKENNRVVGSYCGAYDGTGSSNPISGLSLYMAVSSSQGGISDGTHSYVSYGGTATRVTASTGKIEGIGPDGVVVVDGDPSSGSACTVSCLAGPYGSGAVSGIQAKTGSAVALPASGYTRQGYRQTGWMTESGCTYAMGGSIIPNGDTKLYPVWTAVYTATYEPGPDSTGTPYEQTVPQNGWSSLLVNRFSREGYVMKGWKAASSGKVYQQGEYVQFTRDETYTPVWGGKRYDVVYDPGTDGAGKRIFDVKIQDEDLKLIDFCFTRRGYVQVGWNGTVHGVAVAYGEDGFYTCNESVTLYPTWMPGYKVTYDPGDDGTGKSWYEIARPNEAHTVSSLVFTREGYRQTGWQTASGTPYRFGAQGVRTSTLTLFPVWEELTFQLVFSPGELGTGSGKTIVKPYGVPKALPGPLFKRMDFLQIGWYDATHGKNYALEARYTQEANASFEPVWGPRKQYVYNVTCVPDEECFGSVTNLVKEFGVHLTLEGFASRRADFVQTGWARTKGAAVAECAIGQNVYTNNAAAVLYPVWTPVADIPYTTNIVVSASGGTCTWYVRGTPAGDYEYCAWSSASWVETGIHYEYTEAEAAWYPSWYPEWAKHSTVSVTLLSGTGYASIGNVATNRLAFTVAANTGSAARSTQYAVRIDGSNAIMAIFWQPGTQAAKVNFDLCGGTGTAPTATASYGSFLALSFAAPRRLGYEFLGFYDQASGGTQYFDAKLAALRIWDKPTDATLYAHWKERVYAIAYAGTLGADNPNPTNYTYGSTIVFKALPNVPGFLFDGWSTSCIVPDDVGSQTVRACWTAYTLTEGNYLVVFVSEDLRLMTRDWIPGAVYALPPCTATPSAGKHFAGWSCSNGRRYDDGVLVFNLAPAGETVTMTAIWE